MAELEGKQLGDCEIVTKLGQGGMGAVYKAKQTALDRMVAIKVLPAQYGDDSEFISRFKREAAAAARLTHPNIVQVYSAGVQENTNYFVMEFVDGESVQHRLTRKGKIPPEEALAICVYVAQGLNYAWKRTKLIHRDIKPDNIFLSADGEVKLGDLGLAKSAGGPNSGLTMTGAYMGTPYFVSPEQAQGLKEIDFRADIYSLGCTLYYMVSGHMPYESEGCNALQVMFKHVNEPPPDIFKVWPECPVPLAELIATMVQKKPEERYQSYEELIADMKQVVVELGSPSKPQVVVPKVAVVNQAKPISPVVLEKKTPTKVAPVVKEEKTPQGTPASPKTPIVESKTPSFGLIMTGTVAVSLLVLGLFLWAPWKGSQIASTPQVLLPTVATPHKTSQSAQLLEPSAIRLAVSPDEIPDWRKPRSQWKNGVLCLQGFIFDKETLVNRDSVLRAEILMNRDADGPQLVVRRRGVHNYYRVSPNIRTGEVGLDSVRNGKSSPLKRWPLSREFGTDEWVTVEARIIGDDITISLNNNKLGVVHDSSQPEPGHPALFANSNGFFRNIMYIPLDKTSNRAAVETSSASVDMAFIKEVAALPPEQQVARVVAKLKELNPGYDGKDEKHTIENGKVINLEIVSETLRNISPVRALKDLRTFNCSHSRVSDLSPLKGLQLVDLLMYGSEVRDLSPLRGMPMRSLVCNALPCNDLSPLSGMKLNQLAISHWPVEDLSPIQGMPISILNLSGTKVRDLSPLRGMPVRSFSCEPSVAVLPKNREILLSIKTLDRINNLAVVDFWKQMDAGIALGSIGATDETFIKVVAALPPEQQVARVLAKLKELNLDYDGKAAHKIENATVVELRINSEALRNITPLSALQGLRKLWLAPPHERSSALADLSPLAGLHLIALDCRMSQISDLSPITGHPLEELYLDKCHKLKNLSPLKGMKLRRLSINNNMSIHDFSALQGMPLESFDFVQTRMRDLEVLRGAPLQRMRFLMTEVRDLSPLRTAPLKDFDGYGDFLKDIRNLDVLRSIKTLERICGKPTAEFWRQMDEGKTLGLPAVDVAWQDAINLLPLIDPQKDAVTGTWTHVASGLMSDITFVSRVEIPYRPPAEYDFRLSFTRLQTKGAKGTVGWGDTFQMLQKDGQPFHWYMGAHGNTWFGFELVGGKRFDKNPTGVQTSECLQLQRRYTALVSVRKDSVKAFLDGKLISEWRPELGPLGAGPYCTRRDKTLLGVGACNVQTVFHSIEVREVTGKGVFTRSPPLPTNGGVQIRRD